MNKLILTLISFVISANLFAASECGKMMEEILFLKVIKTTDSLDNSTSGQSSLGKIENLLQSRVKDGELTQNELETFMKNARSLELRDQNFFGEDAIICMDTFSISAVRNFMGLINTMKTQNQSDLFQSLISGSKKQFGDTDVIAKQRVCLLSGKGEKCKIFGGSVLKRCN